MQIDGKNKPSSVANSNPAGRIFEWLLPSGIVVGEGGHRFVDESAAPDAVREALEYHESAWFISDRRMWFRQGPLGAEMLELSTERHDRNVLSAPSVGELALDMGVSIADLCDEVNKFNEAVEEGLVEHLSPPRSHGLLHAISECPFYAVRLRKGLLAAACLNPVQTECAAQPVAGTP